MLPPPCVDSRVPGVPEARLSGAANSHSVSNSIVSDRSSAVRALALTILRKCAPPTIIGPISVRA